MTFPFYGGWIGSVEEASPTFSFSPFSFAPHCRDELKRNSSGCMKSNERPIDERTEGFVIMLSTLHGRSLRGAIFPRLIHLFDLLCVTSRSTMISSDRTFMHLGRLSNVDIEKYLSRYFCSAAIIIILAKPCPTLGINTMH